MAAIEKICSKLGPKWVLLITKLHFVTPRRRYDIEGRHHFGTKVTDRAVYFKNCALDCIMEWMETEALRQLDDEGKVKKLLHELQKIDDFVPLVEEAAALEDIDLSDKSFLDVVAEVTVSREAYASALSSAETGLSMMVESTTRSAMSGFPQPQESWAMTSNVTPLLSPAGVPPASVAWSYGDEVSGGVASLHGHPEEQMSVATPEVHVERRETDRSDRKKREQFGVETREGNLPSGRKVATRLNGEAKTESYSDGATGSNGGMHKFPGPGDPWSQQSFDTALRMLRPPNIGSVDNLSGSASSTAGSQDTPAYDVSIRMNIRRHKFAILDVSQRLPELKWQDIGVKLALDEVFLTNLTKECTEEKYYLMLKKWVELSGGGATFTQLRKMLRDLEEDTALLVLEARLNSRGRILVEAVHHDL